MSIENNDDYTEEDLKQNYNVHDDLKHLTVSELKEYTAKDRLPYAVCAVNVLGDLNIGIIIRNSILMGAERVIVFGKRKFNRKSCVGSYHYIEIDAIGGLDFNTQQFDVPLFWATMDKYNYHPVFIETGDHSSIFKYDFDYITYIKQRYNKKACFIFGSESNGIPQQLMENSEEIFKLSMRSCIRSLNVSSTAAMVLWSASNNYKY